MSPSEFKAARHALGLSAQGMAKRLGIASGRTIRRWEAGKNRIPPTAIMVVKEMLRLAPAEKSV